MGLPPMDNNDGVFHFPADLFLDAAPGQIDVNLPNFESSEHDRDRFASLLNDFDFSAYQADQMNFSQDGPSEIPGMPDTGPWTNWEGAQDSASVATNMDMFSGDVSAQSQQIMMPQVSASSEYSSEPQGHTAMEDQQSEGVPVQSQLMIPSQETQQVMPPMPFSADVLSDPDFQAMFARYLDQKQKQSQQQQPAHHQQQQQQPANEYTQQQQQQQPVAQYTQQASQEQMHQPQPHYAPQPLQPQEQQYQSQYMQQQPQQMHYEGYQYMEQPQQIQQQQHSSAPMHSMSPASTSSEPSTPAANSIPQQNTRYVPPTGAMHARARRVAGSWKAPPVKHEAWSAPQTPVDHNPNSRLPSWAGVPN
ncbi:hypothetical protein BDW22DRAFT_1090273 [Trametopsis cervina]|nr:hypothetical protein BDW22DRAFT_1090273 [Trametopsis cervina]